jgi:hypothetical protein
VKPPGTWSRTQPEVRRLAPGLGEHNQEVLQAGPPGAWSRR